MCAEKVNLFRTVRPSAVTIAWNVERRGNNINRKQSKLFEWFSLALELTVVPILPRYYLESVPSLKWLKNWSLEQLRTRIFSNKLRKHKFPTTWNGTCWNVNGGKKKKYVWQRRRLSWINLQSWWRCKAFKAHGGYLLYYSSAGTLHTMLESVISHCFIEPVASTVNFTHSWTLPSSVRWIFVRNRNWVSWLALPHSSAGLSNDNILLWFFFF